MNKEIDEHIAKDNAGAGSSHDVIKVVLGVVSFAARPYSTRLMSI